MGEDIYVGAHQATQREARAGLTHLRGAWRWLARPSQCGAG